MKQYLARIIVFAFTLAPTLQAQVVINEIHYDPSDRTKPVEFVELHNPSNGRVDLSGWQLDDGIAFTFPPGSAVGAGGYFVVAEDAVAFKVQYGVAPGGVFTGALSNSGERVRLRDALAILRDEVSYGIGFPWPTNAKGGGGSIELIRADLDDDLGGSWRTSGYLQTGVISVPNGTPGSPNSVFALNAPPAIRQVVHAPEQPTANQPVVISAKVSDPDGVGSVTLHYQSVNPGSYIRRTDASYSTNWLDLEMLDDGTGGDALAGDAVYTAVLPASLQTHRRLMRYRITASDLKGISVRVPYSDDEQPNFAYFVHNHVPDWKGAVQPGASGTRGENRTYPSSLLESIQTWHLIANGSDVSNSQYNSSFDGVRFFGTVVYEGRVYDHITFRNRGIGSTYVSGKNKWALAFNRGRNIRVRDNWGHYYNEDWNSFPIDACASPWAALHRGMAGVEEAYSYRMFELAGMASPRTHYMHWRVIDGAAESGPGQYEGDFWGLYMGLEPTEGNFLDERGLPDGNLYAIEGGGGDKKHQGSSHPTSTSDWSAFRAASTQTGQTEAWYRANVDLDSLYIFAAVNRLVGNIDVRGGDNFRFYRRSIDNRWVIIPYDLDMMSIPAHHWGTIVDGVTYAGVPDQIRAITRHPAIAREYRNKARELLDLLGSDASVMGGQAAQLIDEYAQMVSPSGAQATWAGADEAMWSNHPRTNGGGSASGQTSHRNNFFRTPYSDSRGGFNGTQNTTWTRILPDPDGDGYGTFADSMNYLRNYVTNNWPGGTWIRSNGNPRGYGYKYLEWESLYGGLGASPATPDRSFPNTPTITYAGPDTFPANALDFVSSTFSPSATGGSSFVAMQWRAGEILAPGLPGYVPGQPRKYEIEPVWTSPEFSSFSPSVRLPLEVVRPGHTYRMRVRHKDANGSWSHWSPPVQFTPAAPDIEVYKNSLVVSEIMYHPAAVTSAEFGAGFDEEDFEYIELRNVSSAAVDLTGVRFTKGINFDLPSGFSLAAGANTLIVKNVAAFEMRYGSGQSIVGNYGGDSLGNAGEQIQLSFGAGTIIRDFSYSDLPHWPSASDGDGYSLVRRYPENTALDDNLPANWRASVPLAGTPGSDDRPTYPAWAAENAILDMTEDSDHDGLSNLLEYAFASDPASTSPEALPRPAVTSLIVDGVPGDYLTLSFSRRTAAEDVQTMVQFSKSLSDWTLAGVLVQETQRASGISFETWRSPEPILPNQEIYGRVQVTRP